MIETMTVVGMVLSSMPISEYDKRLVILTKDFGKITAFARGARKPTSKYLGGSQPMSFGEFSLYRGRNAYTVTDMKITEYFSSEMKDIDKMYLGMYFLELSDYYGREGIEGGETLKLLYLALKALNNDAIPDALVRCIFELRTLVINGEYANFFHCGNCGSKDDLDYYDFKHDTMLCKNCHEKTPDKNAIDASTLYTLQYIITTPIEKLFHFTVTEDVLGRMERLIHSYMHKHIDKKFNSLKFMENSY